MIMVTIGLAAVLRGGRPDRLGHAAARLARLHPAGTGRALPVPPVPPNRLWAIAIAAVVLVGFTLFFRARATASRCARSPTTSRPRSSRASGAADFALAWALAGVSAVCRRRLLARHHRGSGAELASFGLLVFPVVILGGLDSVPGAIVGGRRRSGCSASTPSGYIGGGLGPDRPYFALLAILLVRPYGLFGQVRIERV